MIEYTIKYHIANTKNEKLLMNILHVRRDFNLLSQSKMISFLTTYVVLTSMFLNFYKPY